MGRSGHRPLPVATFQIEREPGTGYVVTSAEGPSAESLRTSALAALDFVGQPDPNGPSQTFHWIGPIGPAGESVGVVVQLHANGEAKYRQSWFAGSAGRFRGWLPVATCALGVVVGLAVAWMVRGSGATTTDRDTPQTPAEVARDVSPSLPLGSQLRATRALREELSEFLGQEGMAEPARQITTGQEPFVLLVAVTDEASPAKATIRWNPADNARWRSLLQALREMDTRGTDAQSSYK